MQEQINEKTVAISIKTAKLTAEVLQKAVKKLIDARKHKAPKEYRGKQTLKHLMKQNTGVSSSPLYWVLYQEVAGKEKHRAGTLKNKNSLLQHIDFRNHLCYYQYILKYIKFVKGKLL